MSRFSCRTQTAVIGPGGGRVSSTNETLIVHMQTYIQALHADIASSACVVVI